MKNVAIVALLLAAVGGACAQGNFPTRPVRILVTETGGSSDFYVRIIAPALTKRWGKQVIVDNRPGLLSIETLIHAQPDGYNLLFYASALWIGPMMGRGNYDPFRDVMPITLASSAPLVLAVNAALPAKSVPELIAAAKAKPGILSFASGGQGSGGHLAGELLKSLAGIDILRVPFNGAGPATTATITGEVSMTFATVGAVGLHVKSGRLRLLGVGTVNPSPLVPNVPAIAATVPGFDATLIQGMFAPARTPPALIARLQRDIAAVLAEPGVRDKFLSAGTETVGSAPELLAQAMRLDLARYGSILKAGAILR
jgi:tripartite-type tricarboxylate transporter receptor subunit TctC